MHLQQHFELTAREARVDGIVDQLHDRVRGGPVVGEERGRYGWIDPLANGDALSHSNRNLYRIQRVLASRHAQPTEEAERDHNMDFGLTHEQELIVSTVRGFVERELYPLEAEVERTGQVPIEVGREIQKKVKALGFYAPNMPAELGGGGLDRVTLTLLERELGRASMGLSVYWARPSEILGACSDAQKARYLIPCITGEKIDALAMSEPGAGSDVAGLACTARRDGDD